MPEDIIIDFEDLPPGTVVERQYHSKGVEFRRSSFGDAGLPRIEKLADGQAHSGGQGLVIRNCSGEFCPSAVVGKFTHTRQRVQVFVGNLRDISSSPPRVTLFAYDASGEVLTSFSTVVSVGGGVQTLLEISRPIADIDAFEVRATGFTSRLAIDDLRFDSVDTPAAPDFGLSREGPAGDGVRQGFSTTATIKLNRINGSVGAIQFEASGLPAGVTAAFTPNPADAESLTLTLTAAVDAALATGAPVTITATPLESSAGSTQRTLVLPLTVAGNFAIAPLTIDTLPCATTSAPLKIYVPHTLGSPEPGLIPRSAFNGSIELSLGGPALPPGVQVTFDPPSVSFAGVLEATTTVRATTRAGSMTGNLDLAVIGTSTSHGSVKAGLTLHSVAGVLDSFSPKSGKTPHALQPGTEITLSGIGFCSDPSFPIEVQFDNIHARAKVTSVSPDGRQARVRVPRLATDGPLTVITPAGTFTSKESFTVHSHRNTHGFAFENFTLTDVTYDDLSEAFGKHQTHLTITVDPCAQIPFVDPCPILEVSTIPNPIGYLVLLVAKQLDAHCFGISLTSERLLKGETSFSAFSPPGATSVWQLSAPDRPAPALGHHLRIQSISQFSSEVSRHWLSEAGNIWAPASTFAAEVPEVRAKITKDLQAGNYPLIMMRNGGKGHVVVAYDLEDGDKPGVAFYIYIYDPNTEFARGKFTDNAFVDEDNVAKDHREREQLLSRITIFSDGRWEYPGLGKWGPFFFHSKSASLVVTPYNVIPRNPTFPATVDGVATLVFGTAEVAQITDADGRTLFAPDGTPNADPATRLPEASPWAPFNQGAESALADGYLLGGRGHYQWTLRGTDNGSYSNIIFGQGFGAHLDNLPVNRASLDDIFIHPGEASFAFHTDDSAKPLAVTLVTSGADDTSVRTLTLKTTSHGIGFDRVAFDAARQEISYQHEGEPTTYSITLGRAGGIGLPESFTSPPLEIFPGELAVFRPTDWRFLGQSPVEFILTRADGTQQSQKLSSVATQPLAFEIVRLQVEDADDRRKILQVFTRFSHDDPNATAIVIWLVMKDGNTVGQSHVALSSPDLQTDLRSDNWIFIPQEPGQYEFIGIVAMTGGQLPPSSQILHQILSFTVA